MHLDRMVSRIILLAKLPGNNRRAEVAEELRSHLEDLAEEVRSQGYDEEALNRIVRMRFGEAEEIAGAFASVYAPERLAKLILQSAMLVTASTDGRGCGDWRCAVDRCDLYRDLSCIDLEGHPSGSFRFRRRYGGLLQRVRWGAHLSDVSNEGPFAKRHFGCVPRRGFRLLGPAARGTAIGCLCVCRSRSPVATRRGTFRVVRRNGAAAADGMGAVWSADFRMAVPMVGVGRLNSFLQGITRNRSAVRKSFCRGFCVSENTSHFRRSPAIAYRHIHASLQGSYARRHREAINSGTDRRTVAVRSRRTTPL